MEKSLVKNAADEQQVKEAGAKQRFTRETEINDLKAVMGTPAGRRIFWKILSHCGVYETVMSSDSNLTSYNAGKQDVGHFVQAELNDACPDEYDLMFKEARKAKRNV